MPIFQNKDKVDITNYCPITILPVISKVYEKDFIIDSITISLLITYYHHLNLVSDQDQSPNMLNCNLKKVAIATFMDLRKRLTVWMIIFYYLN